MLAKNDTFAGLIRNIIPLALFEAFHLWRALLRPWVWPALGLYLWHLTVLALLVGLAHLAGGIGLHWPPGGAQWWWGRVPWFLALAAGLVLLLPLVGRFERSPPLPEGFHPSTARILCGAALVSAGIAFLALGGIAVEGGVGVRGAVVAGTIIGAWMLGAIGTRWHSV
jgi:hypothetical protein